MKQNATKSLKVFVTSKSFDISNIQNNILNDYPYQSCFDNGFHTFHTTLLIIEIVFFLN